MRLLALEQCRLLARSGHVDPRSLMSADDPKRKSRIGNLDRLRLIAGQGSPDESHAGIILVRHGHVDKEMMTREQITPSELNKALRREGHTSLTKIRYVVLENDGSITVGTRLQR